MRLFIAITLPNRLKNRIGEAQQSIQEQVRSGRFTDRDNLHLTLHFLGQIQEGKVPDIKKAMDQVAIPYEPFHLHAHDLGHFTKRNRKIIYLGVDGALEVLQSIYQKMSEALLSMDIPVEDRPYTPHITLARQVRADAGLAVDAVKDRFVVSGITLMHSTRVDDRLCYIPIHRSPFGQGELILERIEGSVALLENLGGDRISADVKWLPPEAKEGSVLIAEDGGYRLEEVRTKARQEAIDQRLERLKKRK